jgi:hypothetical protein
MMMPEWPHESTPEQKDKNRATIAGMRGKCALRADCCTFPSRKINRYLTKPRQGSTRKMQSTVLLGAYGMWFPGNHAPVVCDCLSRSFGSITRQRLLRE